ncbi:MAG: hypothetical protein Q9167_001655 [Letrouitia subvulpina]
MKSTSLLRAAVGSPRFLTPHSPTGLTGLFTHPRPRPHLLYLYTTTLSRLALLPPHSIYRQATESLTKHRLEIIRAIKPEGFEEWKKRAEALLEEHPDLLERKGEEVFQAQMGWTKRELDDRDVEAEWDGPGSTRPTFEGPRSLKEGGNQDAITVNEGNPSQETLGSEVQWEPEPPLEAAQVTEIEEKIGQGLIEEVIQVAEGELKLVETMLEHKVWEELTEKAPEGQWAYFARDQQ